MLNLMEKQSKQKNKKQKSRKTLTEDELAKSVPSAPLLEDFISDDTSPENRVKQCEENVNLNTVCEVINSEEQNQLHNEKIYDDPSKSKITAEPKHKQKLVNKTGLCQSTDYSHSKSIDETPLLYPDLSSIKVLSSPELFKNNERQERKIAKLSIHDFYKSSSKNPFIKHSYDYVQNFLLEYNNTTYSNDFYCMIKKYFTSRIELNSTNDKISDLKNYCSNLNSSIWSIDNCVAEGNNICKDNIKVLVKHEYQIARLHQAILDDLKANLKKLRQMCHKDYVNISHKTLELKEKIEQFVLTTCNNSSKSINGVSDLKLNISILFYFVRKYEYEKIFINDIKRWLDIFVKVYLSCDNSNKELFLLNHILRCPPGISWAIKYFQCPAPTSVNSYLPNSSVYLCLEFLYTILSPIDKREEFLKSDNTDFDSLSKMHASWILVDSDGEDDCNSELRPLKETDIILLINQIPFEQFFSSILLYNKTTCKNANESYEQFITFIKFCTEFVFILCKGLKTYSLVRYSSLSLVIGRLIKHTLDYVTEEFKIYVSQSSLKSVNEEFDSFCIRIVQSIVWSNNYCKWQILSTFAWEQTSIRSLWCILDHIFNDREENDWALHKKQVDEYISMYENKDEILILDWISSLTQNEQYFFLHTLSNMIIGRSICDYTFIINAVDLLIKVGFSESNSSNSKWCRIYISTVCEQHTQICSYLVFKKNLSPSAALYLFQEINLLNWKLQLEDLACISIWLLNFEAESSENKLGRHLLLNLNYGFNSEELFLDTKLHFEIGLLVVKSCLAQDKIIAAKHKSLIADGIKHVTNLVWTSASNNYHKWCFKLLQKLKIHCLSQTNDTCKSCCSSSKDPLKSVCEAERYEDIREGVNNNHPVACYFVLLATTWGHNVPVIYSMGLNCLKTLYNYNEYEAVIHILYLIVPLFLDCQDELIENQIFSDILNGLVSVSLSNKLFGGATQIPNSVENLNNMIIYQIMSFVRYGFHNPSKLITFWLKSVLKLDWSNALVAYILNNLSQMVYAFPNSEQFADDIIKSMFSETSSNKKSIFKWIYSSNDIKTYSNNEAPWFQKIIIQIKHYLLEETNNLWQEIIEQMNLHENKFNLEKSLKKATSIINVNTTVDQLCIYQWADLGLKIPIDSSIAPLVWQQFFHLLLKRKKLSNGKICCFGINLMLSGPLSIRSLKEHFEKAQKEFSSLIMILQKESIEGQLDEIQMNKLQLYQNLNRLYGLFIVWLTDKKVFDTNFNICDLAPHYEPSILHAFMTNNYEYILPFIDNQSINKSIMVMVKKFEKILFMEKMKRDNIIPSHSFSDLTSIEKIKAKITSYETPMKFGECFSIKDSKFCSQNEVASDLSTTKRYLQKHFNIISQYAKSYSNKFLEHTSLDFTVLDLYPNLYQNMPCKKIMLATCSSAALYDRLMRRDPKPCMGPVEVLLEYSNLQVNEAVETEIKRNLTNADNLISSVMSDVPKDLCLTTAVVKHFIRLVCENKSPIGKDLFYFILEMFYKERHNFFPLDNLFDTCLTHLAKAFYYNDAVSISELFNKIEYNINYLPLISNFLPLEYLTPEGFVSIYSCICRCNLSGEDKLSLLQKFDINTWITTSSASHIYILELIHVLECSIFTYDISNFEEIQNEIHNVLVKHLLCICNFNYPSYYWYILEIVLKGIENLNISSYCLYCFIDEFCLNQKKKYFLEEKLFNAEQWFDIKHSPKARAILLDTCSYLYKYFLNQRLHCGVYGLYSRYQKYLNELRIFLGIITCCTVNVIKEMIVESIKLNVAETVSRILSMWNPWLLPMWTSRLQQKPPEWVQKLSIDGLLLPCCSDDLSEMNNMVLTFIDCCIVFDSHLKDGSVKSYILDFYITEFCYPKVPSYIIKIINAGLLKITWKSYNIQAKDIVNMHRVFMQFLPDNHYLIGQIFAQMNWQDYFQPLWNSDNKFKNLKLISTFIDLLVHVAYEPSLRNKSSMLATIDIILAYDWTIIDSITLEKLTNWFVLTANPLGIISKSGEYATDRAVLRIIDATLGMQDEKISFSKVFILIRCKVKLLDIIIKRNLDPDLTNKVGFLNVIENLFDVGQKFMSNQESNQQNCDIVSAEGSELFKEIFTLLNSNYVLPCQLSYTAIAQKTIIDCIDKCIQKNCIKSILRIIKSVNNESLNGTIMEKLLIAYFKTVKDVSVKHWDIINEELGSEFVPSAKFLGTSSCIMSLHLFYTRLSSCNNIDEQVKNLQIMLDNLHYITFNLDNEQYLPLLWYDILKTVNNLNKDFSKVSAQYLSNFCEYLESIADASTGILEMIKLKRNSISDKFRLICRILQVILLSNLCIINDALELKKFNRELKFYEDMPKFESAKYILISKKTNGTESLLLKKGLEYINAENNCISLADVLKSLLSIAYDQPYFLCL